MTMKRLQIAQAEQHGASVLDKLPGTVRRRIRKGGITHPYHGSGTAVSFSALPAEARAPFLRTGSEDTDGRDADAV